MRSFLENINEQHRFGRHYYFSIPSSGVESKLGEDCTIHMSSAPVRYAPIWKEPLHLSVGVDMEGQKYQFEELPDLVENMGRLYMSERAYDALHDSLKQDGEFLPVTYDGGSGYIFNPLTIAEDHDALGEDVTTTNEWDELQSLGFFEEKLPAGTMLFRCRADYCHGLFCTERFVQAVRDAGLTGALFQPDLANIFGPDAKSPLNS